MNRRILGLLLALCMVLSLLPPVALAAETEEVQNPSEVTMTMRYSTSTTLTTWPVPLAEGEEGTASSIGKVYYATTTTAGVITDVTAAVEADPTTAWNIKLDNTKTVAELTLKGATVKASKTGSGVYALTISGEGALKIIVEEASSVTNTGYGMQLDMAGGTTITSVNRSLLTVTSSSSSGYYPFHVTRGSLTLEKANIYTSHAQNNASNRTGAFTVSAGNLVIDSSTIEYNSKHRSAILIDCPGTTATVTIRNHSKIKATNTGGGATQTYPHRFTFMKVGQNDKASSTNKIYIDNSTVEIINKAGSWRHLSYQELEITNATAKYSPDDYNGHLLQDMPMSVATTQDAWDYILIEETSPCTHEFTNNEDIDCNICGELRQPVTLQVVTGRKSTTGKLLSVTAAPGEIYYGVADGNGLVEELVTEEPEGWDLKLDNTSVVAELVFNKAYLNLVGEWRDDASNQYGMLNISGNGALKVITESDSNIQSWDGPVITTSMAGGTTYTSVSNAQLKVYQLGTPMGETIYETKGTLTFDHANVYAQNAHSQTKWNNPIIQADGDMNVIGGRLEVVAKDNGDTTYPACALHGIYATGVLTLSDYALVTVEQKGSAERHEYTTDYPRYGVNAGTIVIDKASLYVKDNEVGLFEYATSKTPIMRDTTAQYSSTVGGALENLPEDTTGTIEYPYVVFAANCEHDGAKQTDCTVAVYCSICQNELYAAKEAHTPVGEQTNCAEAVKCANCDQIAIAAKDHVADEDDGDCATPVVCTVCGQEVIAAKDHDFDTDPATDDKCKNENCNVTAGIEHVHVLNKVVQVVEPTCTEQGYTIYGCECGEGGTENRDFVPAAHKLTKIEAKAPTCSVAGWEAYEYCTACDYTTFKEVPATNEHNYNVPVETVAPDFGKQGYTTYKCATCALTENRDFTDALVAVAQNATTGTQYETLQAAIDAAKADETVELLADATITADTTLAANVTYVIPVDRTLTVVGAKVTADAAATLNCYGKIVVGAGAEADISELVYGDGKTFGACGGKLTVKADGTVYMLKSWEGTWTPLNDAQLGAMLLNCEPGARIIVGSQDWAMNANGWYHVNHVYDDDFDTTCNVCDEVREDAKVAVAEVEGTKYETLQAAIDAAEGKTVKLLANIEMNGVRVNITTNCELDLNSYTLTSKDGGDPNWMAIYVNAGKTFTLDDTADGGKIVSSCYGIYVKEGATFNMKDGTIKVSGNGKFDYGVVVWNGTFNMNGGTIDARVGVYASEYYRNKVNEALAPSNVVINNGVINANGAVNSDGEAPEAIVAEEGSVITVNGGSFSTDVSEYIPAGKHMAENDGFYTICTGSAKDAVVENVKEATCTEDGSYDLVTYCDTCNKVLEKVTVPVEKTGHAWDDEFDTECNNNCGTTRDPATYADSIATNVDSYGELTVDGNTVTLNAVGTVYCKKSAWNTWGQWVGFKIIVPEGVDPNVAIYTRPNGTSTKLADVCDDAAKTYANVYTNMATVESGIATYQLDWNGDGVTDLYAVIDVTNAILAHEYTSVVTDPTCTEEGYTTYTCGCGESYVGDKVPALGHSFAEDGYCEVCGDPNPEATFVAIVGEGEDAKEYTTLEEAIANAEGTTVTLKQSIVSDALVIHKNVTINLNDNILYFRNTADKNAALTIASGKNVTITNGSVRTSGTTAYATLIENNGTLLITDVLIRATSLADANAAVLRNNGTATINGSSFVLAADKTKVAIVNEGTCVINIEPKAGEDARVQGMIQQISNELTLTAVKMYGKLEYTAGTVTRGSEEVAVSVSNNVCWNGTALDDHSFTNKKSSKKAEDADYNNPAKYFVMCDHCNAISETDTVEVGAPLAGAVAQVGEIKYGTLIEAIEAAYLSGDEVKLLKSVVSDALSIEDSVNINLNDNILYFRNTADKNAALTIASGKNVTITNGSVRTSGTTAYATLIENNGTLLITDVLIRATSLADANAAVLRNNGTATINGSSFVLAADKTKVAIVNEGTCVINIEPKAGEDARVQGMIQTVEGGLSKTGTHYGKTVYISAN